MLTNEEIRRQAELQHDYVIECRRTIHRFAEVSGTEFKTSAFIEGEIKKTGLPYEKAGDTGWIAILDTGKPGPRIGFVQISMRCLCRKNPTIWPAPAL